MCAKRKRPAKGPPNGGPQPASKRAKPDANGGGSSLGASGPGLPKALTAKLLADRRPFVEDMKPEDHERERGLYKLLSSTDVEDRLRASDVIVSCLLGNSSGSKSTKKKSSKVKEGEGADHEGTGKESGVPESVLRRHLERRLFRGLSSGSDAARVGFSYVLVEIICQLLGEKDLASSRYPGLTFEVLLNMLVEKTTTVGKVLGQEERDNWWGRLFGLRCFVQAGVLFTDKTRWKAVLKLLLQLSKKKSWLQPQCGFVIAQAVPLMKRKLAEKTLDELTEAGLAKSPEGLGIWLVSQGAFSDIKLPKPWQDPLGTKSLQDAAAVLKGSTQELSDEDGGQAAKQSYTMAQLHFVWDLILDSFKKQESVREFKVFWDRVVDQSFFSKNASDHQKLSGFKLFQKVLESYHSSPTMVEAIFSQHLMGCLMNQASAEGRHLNRAAVKSLKAVETTVEQYPKLLLRILPRLLGENGAYNFDERTHNKTVEKILRFTRPEDGQAVMETLQTLVKKTADDDEAERRLRIYADYVSRLVMASTEPKLKDEKDGDSVGGLALLELAKLAYSRDYSDLTARTRSSLRVRLTSSFAKVIKRPEDFTYICDAMLSVEPDSMDMGDDVQSELAAALERLQKLVRKSEKKKGSGVAALRMPRQGLALLHAIAILQLYNEDPDAFDVLADTKQCYEKLKEKEKETGDGSGMAEFLVEILLSMIAQPSSLMRQASLLVFEAFSPLMTPKALELLTGTLSVEENANGQKTLFNAADEDEMDVDGDEEEDDEEDGLSEIDSDVEFIGMADGNDAEAPDGDSDGNDDDNEGDEDTETKGNEESDEILAKILGTHRLDQDKEAESSDDDADMTDSEMVALDDKLAEYFKHRVKGNNKRKEKKDAKESVINFKHRVLDFLAAYVKTEAAGPNYLLAFDLLLPLLQHIRTTTNKPLSSKACGIVLDFPKHRKKTKSDKAAAAEDVDADALLARLKLVHDEAGRDQSHAFARAAATASLAMATAIVGAGANHERVVHVYADTQTAWLQGKVRIQPSFFVEWINWCQSRAQSQVAKEAVVEEAAVEEAVVEEVAPAAA